MSPDYCPYRGLQPYTEEDRRFFLGASETRKSSPPIFLRLDSRSSTAGAGLEKLRS